MKETNFTRLFQYKEARQMLVSDLKDIGVAIGMGIVVGLGLIVCPTYTNNKLEMLGNNSSTAKPGSDFKPE